MVAFISADILEVFGLDPISVLYYLGNFLILVGVLVAVLYKPTKKMLENKRAKLDEIFKENERLKSESEINKSEYEKKFEDMKLESAGIASKVAAAAQERADAIVKDAQEQAQSIVSIAKKEAAMQREQLKSEYRDSVNGLAVQIAQKLLEREISEKDNAVLIEQVLSDWEDAD